MVWSHPINDTPIENITATLIVALIFLLGALAVAATGIASVAFTRWAINHNTTTTTRTA